MLRLVSIDLSGADVRTFENYESKVLALVAKYGGRVEARVRSLDGQSETHLIFYPDRAAYDAYLADPVRQVARTDWERCGAKSESTEVERVLG